MRKRKKRVLKVGDSSAAHDAMRYLTGTAAHTPACGDVLTADSIRRTVHTLRGLDNPFTVNNIEATKVAKPKTKFERGQFVFVRYDSKSAWKLAVIEDASDDIELRHHRDFLRTVGRDPGPIDKVRVLDLANPYAKSSIFSERGGIKAASAPDVAAHKAEVARLKAILADPRFKVGEKVIVRAESAVQIPGFFGPQTIILPKGTEAVVDTNPVQPVDDPTTEKGVRAKRGEVELGNLPGHGDDHPWSDYMVPAITLYFTAQDGYLKVDPKHLAAGTYDDRLFRQLVLPVEHKQRLMALADRALKPDTQKVLYERLGMEHFCQKGRGAICLLYGEPGTGKTMTAEAVADKLKRPLIRVSVGGALDPDTIHRLLSEAFKRAERYNAVLLIDEADVFIRKRGTQPLLDGVVAGFLRALEYYRGMLFLTTNLVRDIDPAVFSRAHMVLGYEPPDIGTVWDRLMPDEIKGALLGGASAWPTLLEALRAVKLNGREIKTVIQNAVTRAAAGRDEVPATGQWINGRFFREEAELLHATREELRRS